MKNFLFWILIAVLFSIPKATFSQTWQWSNHAGGPVNYDVAKKVIVDRDGNSYLQGYYTSDTCYFNTDTLIKACSTMGCYQYYLAKYNTNGNELWVRGMDGSLQNNLFISAASIEFDSINNYVYLAGAFKGSGKIGGISLATTSPWSMILAKFDTSGRCIWAAKAEAGGGYCSADAIAIDQHGNIIIGGRAGGPATFDTIGIAQGYFLAKYDSIGHCLWAKQKFNTNSNGYGYDVILSHLKVKNNDIFGLGNSTVSTFTVDTVIVNPDFSDDQYIIARFDSMGNAKWVKPCAGRAIGLGVGDIIVGGNNDSYITGFFENVGIFEGDTLKNSNFEDMFLAKYDPSGHPLWVRQANSSNGAGGYGLAFGGSGVYLNGSFTGSVNFGSNFLVSSPKGDMFITKYDTAGNCIGAIQVANATGASISTDTSASIYVAGSFSDTTIFGSNSALISRGTSTSNIYIAKSTAITGIEEEGRLASNHLLIYANPTVGTCNVTIPDEFQNQKHLVLSIYDNNGKVMQQLPVEINADKVRLNLEEEAKGVYNVVLSNGKKSYTGKIVFE